VYLSRYNGRLMRSLKYLEEDINWIKGKSRYSVGTTAIHIFGVIAPDKQQ
jgi:hypothetical protein